MSACPACAHASYVTQSDRTCARHTCEGGCSFWDCSRAKGHAGPCQPAKRRKSAPGIVTEVHTQGLKAWPAHPLNPDTFMTGPAVVAQMADGGVWAIVFDAEVDGFFAIARNAEAINGRDIDWDGETMRDIILEQLHSENGTRATFSAVGRSTDGRDLPTVVAYEDFDGVVTCRFYVEARVGVLRNNSGDNQQREDDDLWFTLEIENKLRGQLARFDCSTSWSVHDGDPAITVVVDEVEDSPETR